MTGDGAARRLIDMSARLMRLRTVPLGVLARLVRRDGACMEKHPSEPPGWLDQDATDAELAALLCAGCPVQDECLESELRLTGDRTVGVWGALPENDRRDLYPIWREGRRDR